MKDAATIQPRYEGYIYAEGSFGLVEAFRSSTGYQSFQFS